MQTTSVLLSFPGATALALSVGLAIAGCSAHSAVSQAAASSSLSAENAEQIVEAYRTRHERRAAMTTPLKDPKSLDDVLEILRLDQIDLFPGAVKFAVAEGSPRGKALAAQILIAWGDAQHVMGHLLRRAAHDLRQHRQRLEKRRELDKISPDDQRHLDEIGKALDDLEGVEHALSNVGSRHIKEGAKLALEIIAAAPNDYEGYRVAADYYLEIEDWGSFDQMIAKIEALKPDSAGLLFLRGWSAMERNHDKGEAKKLFKAALAKDPKFARAQVGLLLLQPDLLGAYTEMRNLAGINPYHQIVVWMGPTLEQNYREWRNDKDLNSPQGIDRGEPEQRL